MRASCISGDAFANVGPQDRSLDLIRIKMTLTPRS
jgi:hypothetical protein